jgi:tetratricopeptide (TPR) repeat protein
MRNPSARTWLLLVIAFATLERVVFLASTWTDPVFRIPYLDGAFYHAWARSLATGQGDFHGPYFLGPLYPRFLSVLYRIGSPDPSVVRLMQSAIGIAATALVFSLGSRCFGVRAGVIAACACMLHGPMLFYENLLLQESLWMALGLAAAWTVMVPKRRTLLRGALAGLLIGTAALGRATALALLPVALWVLRAHGGTRWRPALACVLACGVVIAPVVVRNAKQGVVAITTNGGINFYAGNGPGANGRFREPPGVAFFRNPVFTSPEIPPAVAARALRVDAIAGTEAAADSRTWTARTWESIGQSPARFAGLFLRRAWLISQAREIAQVESYAFHAQRMPMLRFLFVNFGWLWPFALLGLWSGWNSARGRTLAVAGFMVAALFTCLVFFVTTRYRLAAVPFAAVLAGHGLSSVVGWVRGRAWSRVVVACLILLASGIVTRLGAKPPRGANGWDAAQMAERLYASGDLAGAIRYQERAAAILPERLEVGLNLALYWSERGASGDLDRAERTVRELVRRAPDRAILHFNLGVLLEQQGRLEEARACWMEALRLDPGFEPARSRLLRPNGPKKDNK